MLWDKEKSYLLKRRIKAVIESIPYYVCRIFPIQKNKIVMWTFEEKGGYCDSPKYIADEILCNYSNKYSIVWLADDMTKTFPKEIKVIKNTLWSKAYHLSTADYWISNTRTFFGTKKRKKTTYIQTWHAICGIKPIGYMRGERLSKIAELVSKSDSEMIDYLLYGNEWGKKMWPTGLLYNGKMINTGVPRCDIIINDRTEIRKTIREIYNIPKDYSIVLYAPTFRGGSQSTKRSIDVGNIGLDTDSLINVLNEKFFGKWAVFLRLHPQLAEFMDKMPIYKNRPDIVDVSQHSDMNELIAASDLFITDYSSAVFESALIKQPSFLFIEDKEEYVKDRGNLVFDIEQLPFPSASTMNELIEVIKRFDKVQYEKNVDAMLEELGVFENGNSAANVVKFMEGLKKSE